MESSSVSSAFVGREAASDNESMLPDDEENADWNPESACGAFPVDDRSISGVAGVDEAVSRGADGREVDGSEDVVDADDEVDLIEFGPSDPEDNEG